MRSIYMMSFALPIAAMLAAARPAAAQDDAICLMCHADASLFAGTEDSSRLVVSEEVYAGSVHGAAGFPCTSCHQGVTFPHTGLSQPVDCGLCHSDFAEVFANSMHGHALQHGYPRAPTCASCHGTHDILPSSDPRSRMHKVRVPATCGECHGAGLLTDRLVKLPRIIAAYAQSVHGAGTERGLAAAASCADCHEVHDVRGPADPASAINYMNVAATCGQCHPDVEIDYRESIHGRALEAGVTDSPTCTNCHGEHLILSPGDPDADTYSRKLATETCGACHDDPIIIAKYDLEGGVVGSYVDSYHGWASRRDYESAATCVDCHTAHSVLPEEDSASTIHPDNVVATCGQCHDNADVKFAASYTHTAASITKNPVNRLIRSIYIVLIIVVIGGMVLHNLVILSHYAIKRWKEERAIEGVLRLDRTQVVQHLLLTISFVLLVITGFALRFPEAWWVRLLSNLGMTEPVRADLHRINAVLLVLVAISHVYYIVFRKGGRVQFSAMLPRLQDLKDFYDTMRYYTWWSENGAKFSRYDYMQKAEYWALAWGTALMAVTGVVLWFPTLAVKIFPAIVITLSQTIHYYEAWLATLAILVWHFFFVFFHPDEYPMNWSWLTGKMSRDAAKKHHARWYEEELAVESEEESGTSESTPAREA